MTIEIGESCGAAAGRWFGNEASVKIGAQNGAGNPAYPLHFDYTVGWDPVPLIQGLAVDSEFISKIGKSATRSSGHLHEVFIGFFVHASKVSNTCYLVKQFLPRHFCSAFSY